ncbi:MAG TPA: glycosyltransferase, partial [Candidatus Tenderia electrophaga]|nr:glycosyltransferase [Candidatus Tenderia electrophaga]
AALRGGLFGQRPVWLAASTHAGEDELLLQAFAEVRQYQPDLLLLLVPRHPERFAAVAELCQDQGYEVVRRSEGRPCSDATAVFIGDSMGELLLFLAAADLCFMGGSLVPTGGHNLLEPAAVGVPVVFGPHMFNFAVISQMFLERDAARQVADSAELARVVAGLFENAGLRRGLSERAGQLLLENRGAQARLEALIEQQLSSSSD